MTISLLLFSTKISVRVPFFYIHSNRTYLITFTTNVKFPINLITYIKSHFLYFDIHMDIPWNFMIDNNALLKVAFYSQWLVKRAVCLRLYRDNWTSNKYFDVKKIITKCFQQEKGFTKQKPFPEGFFNKSNIKKIFITVFNSDIQKIRSTGFNLVMIEQVLYQKLGNIEYAYNQNHHFHIYTQISFQINKYTLKKCLYKCPPRTYCIFRLESCDRVSRGQGGHSNGPIVAQRRSWSLCGVWDNYRCGPFARLSYVT